MSGFGRSSVTLCPVWADSRLVISRVGGAVKAMSEQEPTGQAGAKTAQRAVGMSMQVSCPNDSMFGQLLVAIYNAQKAEQTSSSGAVIARRHVRIADLHRIN